MQSETEKSFAEVDVRAVQEGRPRSFELYEEYSGGSIADTIRMCRERFRNADNRAKRELEREVESKVRGFCRWLEKTKNVEPVTAYYYSIGLKSLLFGLPVGVKVAQLFGAVLDKSGDK